MDGDDTPKQRNERMRDTVRVLIGTAFLAGLTASFWFADRIFPDISLEKLYLTFLGVTIIYLIFTAIRRTVLRQIREPKTRYSFTRTFSVLYYIVVVAYGIIGADIAVATENIIVYEGGPFEGAA
jgi:preprotein translocase subunit SecE